MFRKASAISEITYAAAEIRPCGRGGFPACSPQSRREFPIMIAPRVAAIPGTVIFDSAEAQKGYALNRMCYSFNDAENRAAFLADEDAYCARYGLNHEQREAVRRRNVLAMIRSGGNVYYLAKLAGIFGLDVQDIGAQQTGVSLEAFKAKLIEAGD